VFVQHPSDDLSHDRIITDKDQMFLLFTFYSTINIYQERGGGRINSYAVNNAKVRKNGKPGTGSQP